jgi:hypothetical protein
MTTSKELPCRWHEDIDTGSWDTDCGNKFQFHEAGPVANGMRYCPYCGKPLKEVRGGKR